MLQLGDFLRRFGLVDARHHVVLSQARLRVGDLVFQVEHVLPQQTLRRLVSGAIVFELLVLRVDATQLVRQHLFVC